jgi:dCMP deaminase
MLLDLKIRLLLPLLHFTISDYSRTLSKIIKFERINNLYPANCNMKANVELKPYGEKQQAFDKRYLEMALIWAKNSYCRRRQVGALIVKGKMIISDGYNGTPSGFENICEDENNVTKPYVLHAEANAITKVAKSNNSSEGSTLYVTSSPCMECSKLIIQSGIKRVVYCNEYHNIEGLELLKRAGIELVYVDNEKEIYEVQ